MKKVLCLILTCCIVLSMTTGALANTYEYPTVSFVFMSPSEEEEFRTWVYDAVIDYVNKYYYLYNDDASTVNFGKGNNKVIYQNSSASQPWKEYYNLANFKWTYDYYFGQTEKTFAFLWSVQNNQEYTRQNMDEKTLNDFFTMLILQSFQDVIAANSSLADTYASMGRKARKYVIISPKGSLEEDTWVKVTGQKAQYETNNLWLDVADDLADCGWKLCKAGLKVKNPLESQDFDIWDMVEEAIMTALIDVAKDLTTNMMTEADNDLKLLMRQLILDEIMSMTAAEANWLDVMYNSESPSISSNKADIDAYVKPNIQKMLQLYEGNQFIQNAGLKADQVYAANAVAITNAFKIDLENIVSTSVIVQCAIIDAIKETVKSLFDQALKAFNEGIKDNPDFGPFTKFNVNALIGLVKAEIDNFSDIVIENLKSNNKKGSPKTLLQVVEDSCDDWKKRDVDGLASDISGFFSTGFKGMLDEKSLDEKLKTYAGKPGVQLAFCMAYWAANYCPSIASKLSENGIYTVYGVDKDLDSKELIESGIQGFFKAAGKFCKALSITVKAERSEILKTYIPGEEERKNLINNMSSFREKLQSLSLVASACDIFSSGMEVGNSVYLAFSSQASVNHGDYGIVLLVEQIVGYYEMSNEWNEQFYAFVRSHQIGDILDSSKTTISELAQVVGYMREQVKYDEHGTRVYQTITLKEPDYHNTYFLKYLRGDKVNIKGIKYYDYVNAVGTQGRLISYDLATVYNNKTVSIGDRLYKNWNPQWDTLYVTK